MEFIAFTLDLIGKLMIAFTAIMVHHRVHQEHKIDQAVFDAMQRERNIAIFGIFLMITGYLFHMVNILYL